MEHAIAEFLGSLETPVLLVILAVGIAILVKGADLLVDGAVGISERLGVPKVIIGATIVSIGTTTPEAAVSVMAAFKGEPGMALGNSIGSIICDTGLIFGLCCLLTRLPMDKFILNRHGWLQFGSGFLLAAVALLGFNSDLGSGVITRPVGVFFIALLIAYLLVSVYWAKQHGKDALEKVEAIEQAKAALPGADSVLKHSILMILGLGMVLMSSQVLLADVGILCIRWGVPSAIIAATLVAFGTSLPELVTALTSIRKGHKDLLVGNIIGADILNVLFVTGAAACAANLTVEPVFYKLHIPMMLAVLILFRLTIKFSKNTFARWPGVLFLGLYVIYGILNYVLAKG